MNADTKNIAKHLNISIEDAMIVQDLIGRHALLYRGWSRSTTNEINKAATVAYRWHLEKLERNAWRTVTA